LGGRRFSRAGESIRARGEAVTSIRVGLLLLLAFSALAFASVEPWAQACLEIGACALLVLWAVLFAADRAGEFYWNPIGWPLLAIAVIGLIQYFFRLTVFPYATRVELLKLAAYLILFFLAGQAFRTPGHRLAFGYFLLSLGFLISLFGIIQHFTFNGKLYWVRSFSFLGVPFGPFTNRDHFAGFVELIIPVGLSMLLLRGTRRDQVPLVALLTIVPIGAVFLSASRGGIITVGMELVLLTLFLRRRPVGFTRGMAVLGVLLLAAAFVGWLGIGTALERFGTLRSGGVTEIRRWIMIRDSWKICLAHPVFGSGLGTLETAYPMYASYYDGLVVNHSHNDFIETFAETGFAGALCCALFLFGVFRFALREIGVDRDPFDRAVRAGALIACAGFLIHAMVDFNLHIPSNALLFFLQAQIASSSTAIAPVIAD
jgi:O-antigen ligase